MSTAAKTPNYNLSQVAGSDIPDWITDYTSDMSKIDDALKGNADDIATVRPDEFSEESTYAAGDYCIKDNVIYKAKTAVEAGAFDISDWTATTIFDELSGLNQNMPRYETKIYTVDVTTPANETYTGAVGITNEDWYSSAKMIIPLFARKTGSSEICVVEYEFGTIRLQSDISFSGVTVGIGVIF